MSDQILLGKPHEINNYLLYASGSVDSGGFSVRMLYHITHKNEASLLYALGSVDSGGFSVRMLYHIPHKNEVSPLYELGNGQLRSSF
ncbi:hypothetical protein AVEN_32259-1 [Araneus ventricosus]|uniref:Uncharacterized protein n=1 Tax=Araneus ventricosus TaxID=182803 RepID=A0A4Y2Q944_ARAVE|nr:hypothetical protein AVEN_32259-1 [Araneus ventricosus]